MVSNDIVSPGAVGFARFLTVILTARNAVFICGETEVIVPWTIVPVQWSDHCYNQFLEKAAVLTGACSTSLESLTWCEENTRKTTVPFFSSMVTVSFAHFMRNLIVQISLSSVALGPYGKSREWSAGQDRASASASWVGEIVVAHLTSFMVNRTSLLLVACFCLTDGGR